MKTIKSYESGISHLRDDAFDGKDYLVKKMGFDLNAGKKSQIIKIASILSHVDSHPSLAKFSGLWLPQNQKHEGAIIQEFVPQKLEDLIKDRKLVDIPEKINVAVRIAIGMRFLHSKGIVHGNLNPSTILIENQRIPKIGDFGLSRIWRRDLDHRYSAPEIINKDISPSVDVFSFGLIFNQLFSGVTPFSQFENDPVNIAIAVRSGERPTIPSSVPASIKSLIECCWSSSPNTRPTFVEIVEILRNHAECSSDLVHRLEREEMKLKTKEELIEEFLTEQEKNRELKKENEIITPLIKAAILPLQSKPKTDSLWDAEKQNDLESVILHLRNGAKTTGAELSNSFVHGHLEISRVLVEVNPDAKWEGRSNWTLLHSACRYSSTYNLCEKLLKKGTDVNMANTDGWTPLMHSLRYNKPKIAKLLIEHGAKLNSAEKGGWTPLLLSTRYSQQELSLFLIEKGANINARNLGRFTPLIYSLYSDQPETAKTLISKGADTKAKANNGFSALQCAQECMPSLLPLIA